MFQKPLAVAIAALLGVTAALGYLLHSAKGDISTLTSARDAALQDAVNVRESLKTAETQNRALLAGFQAFDSRIRQLGTDQATNARWLAAQMTQLNDIQKQPGDSDESYDCLRAAVPAQLDQWLRDDSRTDGGH